MKRFAAILLSLCLLAPLAGCAKTDTRRGKPTQLKTDVTVQPVAVTVPADAVGSYDRFAVDLFKTCYGGGNTLVSPLSVLGALGMTAGGAAGETLSQMETLFGMSADEVAAYLAAFGSDGEGARLKTANSIWVREDLRVRDAFLARNAANYGAAIYKTAFGDDTVAAINDWIEEHTDGLVKDVLDRVPPDAVMYLVNALALDAKWENIYRENEVQKATFTAADGTKQDADMMYSEESRYLADADATGFVKYYQGRRYAFAALLPRAGISIADYVASLDGEKLGALLDGMTAETVNAGLPRFKTEYSVEMSKALAALGMTDAFDPVLADFSGMAEIADDNNICISRVLHKTYIAVDESGTKAGAATVVEMKECAMFEPEEPKEVILDRPFVYLLIDCENGNAPIFIGTVETVN